MTDRCRKSEPHRVAAQCAALALLASALAVSCGDAPAEPDPTPTPPAPLPVRPELVPLWALYESTNGPEWHHSYNWLTDAPLDTWHGVTVDEQGRVSVLNLAFNNLSGQIPPELGDLPALKWLWLDSNELSGSIPAELGNLGSLDELRLDKNSLSGSIPPELGRLAHLVHLRLHENGLAGPIPSELENLASLNSLSLNDNDLSGPIPPELGNIAGLAQIRLQENRLSGSIPPELGNLGNLRFLWLNDNDLSGAVPPELGRLTRLRWLFLSNNPGLAGPLPVSMIALDSLRWIATDGTALCVPADADFQAWIWGIGGQVPRCLDDASRTTVYLTQAVQSRSIPVPLVADRGAWLRVFVTAPDSTAELIPPVRATFYVDGIETYTLEIPAGGKVIPTAVNEGRWAESANASIPGDVIRPGVELVVEIDPEGTLDAGLGIGRRIPETGRTALDVREMPVLDLTLIPFLWSAAPDEAIIATIDAMAADPEGHDLLSDTRTLLPVAGLTVTAHEPVRTSSNEPLVVLAQTATIWAMEGKRGHYMGLMSGPVAGAGGRAQVRGRSSFVRPIRSHIAHELGHNMSLLHAPCGDPSNVDPSYPHADGSIGSWGVGDIAFGSREVFSPDTPDLMSYCFPQWISGYHFTRALFWRLRDEGAARAAARVAAAPIPRSLLLWGGVDEEDAPFLEPAFVVDAPAALPESGGGAFELVGRSASGEVLFSVGFDMPEIADGDGSSSFAFLLPVEVDWARDLAAVTLSGPGGVATLDADVDRPMVILRNPHTGQVRAFLRDPPPAALAGSVVDVSALSPEPGLEALFSRGLPGPGAWRR